MTSAKTGVARAERQFGGRQKRERRQITASPTYSFGHQHEHQGIVRSRSRLRNAHENAASAFSNSATSGLNELAWW